MPPAATLPAPVPRRPSRFAVLAVALVVAAPGAGALAAPAGAQVPPAPRDRPIVAQVTVAGLPLGGLTVGQAGALLEARLGPRFARPVALYAGRERVALTAEDAKVAFDPELTARRAARAAAALAPGSPPAVVEPAVRVSRLAVKAYVRRVAAAAGRPARDATLRVTVRRMVVRKGRNGRALRARDAFAAVVERALRDPLRKRLLRAPLRRVRPAVRTRAQLAKRHGTVLTVDRTDFRLRLFKRLRLRSAYPIAVGQAGYGTPGGLFRITSRQVDPAWHVPDSPWAGSLAGSVVPGGAANNPLKARWLGITDGVGIHGTAEDWSIGSRASHGCIRMHVSDVVALYPRVPLGSEVLIR